MAALRGGPIFYEQGTLVGSLWNIPESVVNFKASNSSDEGGYAIKETWPKLKIA